jgi:hypothetical protein
VRSQDIDPIDLAEQGRSDCFFGNTEIWIGLDWQRNGCTKGYFNYVVRILTGLNWHMLY